MKEACKFTLICHFDGEMFMYSRTTSTSCWLLNILSEITINLT